MNQLVTKSCSVCSSSQLEVFFELPDMPVFCNLLWSEQSKAENCAKGDLKLAFCPNCGFIQNIAFDPAKIQYTEDYVCSLDFSPRFQDYAQSLAERLIERHNLHQKKIIEIGCGKGDFLLLLCELGNNYGVGFDPSYVHRPKHEKLNHQVKFVQDYYSESYGNYQADLILCRHTLEHIENPAAFLANLKRTIGDRLDTRIFFEVPNALDTVQNLAIWDIIYEHCCYFTPTSLAYAFSSCGFRVDGIAEEYGGQFLCLEASPSREGKDLQADQSEGVRQLQNDILTFTSNFQAAVNSWQKQLQEITQNKLRVVVWGAGSKGVTFLNMIDKQQQIEYVVDINPHKQGKYIAGTGQKIIAPEQLTDYQPDLVIIMNPIYKHEIQKMLEELKLYPELITSSGHLEKLILPPYSEIIERRHSLSEAPR